MASDIIHIEDAFFGRDNAITCSGDRDVTDTECTSASVHDVISTHCNNKNSCVLNVNNVTLGEPCLGTYKYLNINFTCSGTRENELSSHHNYEQTCQYVRKSGYDTTR